MSITRRVDLVDALIAKGGIYDEYGCHLRCGDYYTTCKCSDKELGFTHTARAIDVFKPMQDFTGVDIDTFALDSEWSGVEFICSKHRDSDPIDNHNFESIKGELESEFGKWQVDIIRCSHWAVGWVDYLVCNVTPELLKAVAEFIKAIGAYSLYNEDNFDWELLEEGV